MLSPGEASSTPTRHRTQNGEAISHDRREERQVSQGNVWVVGGLAPGTAGVDDGRGHLFRSGTNARVFTTSLVTAKSNAKDDLEAYHGRVASALKIDCVRRILDFSNCLSSTTHRISAHKICGPLDPERETWDGAVDYMGQKERCRLPEPELKWALPTAALRVLDAPNLRDDFYCSILAYSPICHRLAVGLGNVLYIWSERTGPGAIHGSPIDSVWLTSIAFSSVQGRKCILAIGRSDGSLVLKSIYDALPRFEVQQPFPVACVSWRPICTLRPSRNPLNPGTAVQTEDLIVGDDTGTIYYYVVEWPMSWEVTRDTWPGTIYLVAKISLHTQQICGLSWSPNGRLFASGGNDNLCCLFDIEDVLSERHGSVRNGHDRANWPGWHSAARNTDGSLTGHPRGGSLIDRGLTESNAIAYENDLEIRSVRTSPDSLRNLGPGSERYRWVHSAAVKAIAFCPWSEGLVATGGGSNDKCIHFFHTTSGAALATIAVSAQVTSLIWSSTRREIAATFGYAEPEHPYRIAVFSWPDCKQVAAIPWEGEHRALYAISYPRGPLDARELSSNRACQEECIVVAASDKSVKFHEIWSNKRKTMAGGAGMLGGSDILEGLDGIDKEGDVIR